MAETKQTARRSTGGKAPRKRIALHAARQTCVGREMMMFELSSSPNIEKGMRTPASPVDSANLHIWLRGRSRRYSVTAQEFVQLLGHHIKDYLVRRPNVEVTCEDAYWLGLPESVGDGNRYRTFSENEWDI
ncbi:unnamed protein product [Chondrus crispus]|uniref:Uncharacterized protein n=1 Tax=Chondrus crispus TaxID=2769 RepID=R7QLK7_CHOCR|nr:unnamed protein product [Chondrus crispus]CDF38356.1 unnamed protein product [Chondrus crispus]|eukprot:XP_005718241.1 unnamed protein product [Chondrus crispus]